MRQNKYVAAKRAPKKDAHVAVKRAPKKDAYKTVQVSQLIETSTATGQKIPTQAVPVSVIESPDKGVNADPQNPYSGKSSYVAGKGPGPYGGL